MDKLSQVLRLTVCLLLCGFGHELVAGEHENLLFKLQRSRDADEIVYTLNINNEGSIDQDNPIDVNWVRLSTDGKKEPITWIQNELSFGLNYITVDHYKASFQFACCDQMTFFLKKDSDSYTVYTKVDDRVLEFQRVFLQYNGGTQWLPNVEYAELFLIDPETKKQETKKIYP